VPHIGGAVAIDTSNTEHPKQMCGRLLEVNADPTPVHVRSINVAAYDQGDSIRVRAELTDERPWAFGTHQGVLHAMALSVDIDVESRTIIGARADMDQFPHAECPLIAPAFEKLAGVVVGKGFRQEVLRRVGGIQGCTHLVELCRVIGPAVVQALQSRQAHLASEGGEERTRSIGWATNMCHVLAAGGPAEQKMQAGWRLGEGEFPVPPVEAFDQAESGRDANDASA
jgi:hypothetical protein